MFSLKVHADVAVWIVVREMCATMSVERWISFPSSRNGGSSSGTPAVIITVGLTKWLPAEPGV